MYQSPSMGFLGLLKKINVSSLLDGTSKTLNIVNQAIPIFYQVKPLVSNAKTLFKITNIMNNDNALPNVREANVIDESSNNSPIFFI